MEILQRRNSDSDFRLSNDELIDPTRRELIYTISQPVEEIQADFD